MLRIGQEEMEFYFPVFLDTAKSKISIVESASEMSIEDIINTDSGSLKDLLKEKWKEVNGD